jgi:HAD superfamily hydrolase (TIGR01509 family)
MIKLIAFDLDGVLIDTKHIHYETLNASITMIAGSQFIITESEHLTIYDGLKTSDKLKLLTKNKNLPERFHDQIWKLKQTLTIDAVSKIEPNLELIITLESLSASGYKLACCSNSIKETVNSIAEMLGIKKYFDCIYSNSHVTKCKPYPYIYWYAMITCDVLPEETLIIEDSPIGLLAASRSGAKILRVNNSKDVTISNILEAINKNNNEMKVKWQGNNMNVLIPMAGAGSRFESAGFSFPKPLIDVNGKPMIQVVVENLNVEANYIYVVQKSHREKYNLDTLLNLITPNCSIIEVDGLTEGAACTTLLAKSLIDNNQPLLMANSDQFIEWDSNDFMYKMIEQNNDCGIVTFNSTHPKWSFVKTNDSGYVTEVAEKKPISNIATAGIYYWKRGSDYVKYAEQMIAKNIRINNEFYVCPAFNEAIQDNKRIRTYNIEKMWGLGTPEDLNNFLQNK